MIYVVNALSSLEYDLQAKRMRKDFHQDSPAIPLSDMWRTPSGPASPLYPRDYPRVDAPVLWIHTDNSSILFARCQVVLFH